MANQAGYARLLAVAPNGGAGADRFGTELRRRRLAARLTQVELARRAGLSARSLGDIERGRVRSPRPETVRLLAAALGLAGDDQGGFERLARDDYWASRAEPPAAEPPAAKPPATEPPATEPGPGAPPGRPVPAQLPADVSAFTGRVAAQHQLAGLTGARNGRAVMIAAITGSAGVGKTALAVHWAHQVRSCFPDGQLYLNLRGYDEGPPMRPIDALARLLHGLGVPAEQVPTEVSEAGGLFRSLLADRRVLVVLDNAHCPDQVRPLLPGSPGCLVLVTSRDALTGLVARDGAHRVGLAALTRDEARTLLAHLLGAARVGTEPEAVDELARLCGQLPLALRIAAANLTGRPRDTVAGYVEQLRAGDRLAALDLAGDEQAGVRAAFDLSYAALPAATQRLFRLLGLVPGADVTAAGVAALAGVPAGAAEPALARLVAAHLVEEHRPGRYAVHDLLRLYAAQRARQQDAPGERAAAIERLLGWYLSNADAAARLLYPQMLRLDPPAAVPRGRFDDHASALAWLDAERSNLLAAVQHAADHGPRPTAWLLADTLRGYFWQTRHLVDWLRLAQAALPAAVAEDDQRGQAALRFSLGAAYYSIGRYPLAIEHYAAAAAIADRAGWVEGQAAGLGNLGIVHTDLGDLHRAAECHRQALTLNRRTGRLAGQANNLVNLGGIHRELGQLRWAGAYQAEALALYREVGALAGEAVALSNLGDVRRNLGELAEARESLLRALDLYRRVGTRFGEAGTLRDLAAVHRDTGHDQQALETGQHAQELAREIGDRRTEANVLNLLGSVLCRLGRPQAAVERHQQALALARETGAHHPETDALIGLAAAARDRHQHPRATRYAQQARSQARAAGYRVLEGHALVTLASIELAAGRHSAAAGHAGQALAVHEETGHRLGQARALTLLGHAHQLAGERIAAASCWRRAADVYAACGAGDLDSVRPLLSAGSDRPTGA
jgi:tetratricopeptide (TPR) repeat protein/transcriptional regulator with XRE-family HTH domain